MSVWVSTLEPHSFQPFQGKSCFMPQDKGSIFKSQRLCRGHKIHEDYDDNTTTLQKQWKAWRASWERPQLIMLLLSKKTLMFIYRFLRPLLFVLSKALQSKSRVSLFIYLGCCVSQWHIEKLASAIFTCQSDCNLNWQNKLLFTHSHWLCYVPEALGLFFQLRSPLLLFPLFLMQKHNAWLAGGTWLPQLAAADCRRQWCFW